MIVQKYIVMLSSDPITGRQVFLAYDALGRIGNANYKEAFRYDSELAAGRALLNVRKARRWPGAIVLGTTVETEEG